MNTEFKALKWTLLCAALAGYAAPRQSAAQGPAPAPPPAGGAVTPSSHSNAQAEAGEPRADTSATPRRRLRPAAAAAPAAAKPPRRQCAQRQRMPLPRSARAQPGKRPLPSIGSNWAPPP